MAHYLDVDRDGPVSAIGVPKSPKAITPVTVPLQLRATPPVMPEVISIPLSKAIGVAVAALAVVIAIARVLL